MNDTPAPTTIPHPFAMRRVQFSGLPGQTSLFTDFLDQSEKVLSYYPEKCTPFPEYSKKVLEGYQTDRAALCDSLEQDNSGWGAGLSTIANIARLRNSSTVTVMTGQQAGLFTGPLYTVYKAASAVALARSLTAEGIEAVPVFWVAAEDHDFEEVRSTTTVDCGGELHEVGFGHAGDHVDTPVGLISLDESISSAIGKIVSMLPESEFRSDIEMLLNKCYRNGETMSSAFSRMMLALFGDQGLVMVSPLNSELRRLSLPLVEIAVNRSGEIAEALRLRDEELSSGGYHRQVLVDDDYFPFFYVDGSGKRISLRNERTENRVSSAKGGLDLTHPELVEELRTRPDCLSPNALMRPVVQDFLFPSICYFGGSAEIAYFAQNSAVYELLERPVTPIRHRASCTVIEPKNRRTLEKHRIAFEELFSGKQAMMGRIVDEFLNPHIADEFDKTERAFTDLLDTLKQSLGAADQSLADALSTRQKKILWHISTLREKFRRSETLKNEVVSRRVDYLFSSLLPGGMLQERTLNLTHFLNASGPSFVNWVCNAADIDGTHHQLLSL